MSILRAREEGATFGAIAEAAGTSSQAVQEIVRRHGRVKRAENSGEKAGSQAGAAGSGASVPAAETSAVAAE
ncbi:MULTISPECIES: hypothetical protein [Brevibacterium]|uniref:Uncharacterized protein n=1 Tax=Brevibacterium casei TaxID=33889 RepID=A0A7T4A2T3_9MICO|nr:MULTISPECIES: hypothetical protein [Brevibacterium]MCM1012949.1 hypothetical protein [Brevibacterium sp. XM4083]QQB16228.1 hypothetical protein I6H47_05215 [Brevibacterium casei]